jgi:transglutaminase superfamily protein
MMRLLLGALVTVVRVRIALWILPWHRLARPITIRRDLLLIPPSAERVAWAVKIASRAVPCATCLTQALALHQVLAGYGYPSIVQVGVCHVDGRFLAHAWVEHNEQTLLGTPETIARYSRFFTWPASQIDHS